MAKKRVLCFQTPKKKTQTPLRANKRIEADVSPPADDFESIENKLVESLRTENNFLRNLKSDSLLYNQLLGISINQDGNHKITFKIERASSSGPKKLQFNLEDREDKYIFVLDDSVNCNVPEYFYDIIEFDKRAFPLFFYKAMQAVYETRTN